jgi:hypothetical protein
LPSRLTKFQYACNVDRPVVTGENPYPAALPEYIIMPCLIGAGTGRAVERELGDKYGLQKENNPTAAKQYLDLKRRFAGTGGV